MHILKTIVDQHDELIEDIALKKVIIILQSLLSGFRSAVLLNRQQKMSDTVHIDVGKKTVPELWSRRSPKHMIFLCQKNLGEALTIKV